MKKNRLALRPKIMAVPLTNHNPKRCLKKVMLMSALCFSMTQTAFAADVFINEIHYDNAGSDVGEAVEIAGVAGTDLTGWSIILYNGSNGTSYSSVSLSGIIPDQQGGFGTQFFTKSGIQNGAPDAFALVDNLGVVVEFLSYEGTLTATNGPANGLTSIDIGVAETSSTPTGYSLQFDGSTWQGANANTFGAVNTGQTFDDSGDSNNGDNSGGGNVDDGASGSVCVNCPDLEKVANSTNFDDATYYEDVILAINGGHGTTAIKGEITTAISQNHKDLSYAEVWTALTETDEDPSNSDNVILFYRGISKAKLSNGSGPASSDPENWNREHVWAKSHGGFSSDSQSGYTDIHHLRPTDISVNSTRGNLDFDSGGSEIGEAPGNKVDSNSFEPRDTVKGDVARMVFYMDARYEVADANMPDLRVVESTNTSGPELGRLCRLIEWHNADPIDAFEQKRNNTIYEYQGNRNPFIDHPEWVTTLYGSEACNSDGGGDTGGGDIGGGDTGGSDIGGSDTGGGNTGGSTSNIFINEIHYDNAGGDIGESIEIAGPAGTDLTGMSLVLYNGSNGTTYKTEVLAGILANQQNGFGTLSFDIAGMQNGAPDGIALIDSNGSVLEFISYEGSLTATNGPATGMASTDIGVSEVSSTVVGFSLQLAGIGFTSADFTWQAAAENTFNNVNTNQTFLAGSVFINEIHYDNVGGDTGEAIEVAGPAGTDLSGLSLVLYNGSNGTTYKTVDLSGVLTNQQAGFGTMSFDISGIQNGSPDGIALIDNDGTVIEFLSYEGSLTATNGPASGMISTDIGVSETSNTLAGLSLQLGGTGYSSADFTWEDANANTFNNVNTNQTFGSGGDTGGGDGDGTPMLIGQCSDPSTFIHDIQGNADVSALVGQNLVVEAIVTSVLPALDGFFIQESDTDVDADPLTSEGLFVFNTANTITPSNGDLVRVAGNVSEFFGRTQLSPAQDLIICGTGSVSTTTLSLPFTSVEQPEALEGMLVSNADSLTVSDNYNLAKFGEVTLSSSRLFVPTNIHLPGSAEAVALANENSLNRIILDDGVNGSYPEQIIFPTGGLSDDNSLRIGDLVTELTGIIDYSFSNYRIIPLVAPTFVNDNIRLAQPELSPSNLKIASLNVLNLFNGDGQGGGFPTARGADTAEELERQFAKTVAAIVAIDADVIGLMEIENDGVDANSTLAQLVARINAVVGADTYAFINTGGTIGTDAIAVALLYKPSSVSASGNAMLNNNGIFNRPPLAQIFTLNNNGSAITVVVNHFKSKGGCSSASGADQDQNDGQACFNAKRVAQANELMNWLATDATLSLQEDVLVMGDLNAYAMEDPIRAFTSNGYTNLINQFAGEQAYSYLFGGEVGYLDHALASSSLLTKVVDTTEWHINADEPCVLDYNTELCGSGFSHPDKTADQLVSLYDNNAYRMSDHDPVIVAFDFTPAAIQGDFDGDGDIDINDLRGLMRAIQFGQTIDLAFDLNNDGAVSMMDVRVMMSLCTRTRCAAN
jgi:predicted extracellular nuclease/endonuclease I